MSPASPTAALASLGAWPGGAPSLSGQILTSRGQRLGGWGAGCEPLLEDLGSLFFYTFPLRAGEGSRQQAGLRSKWSWSCIGGCSQVLSWEAPSQWGQEPHVPGAKCSLPLGPLGGSTLLARPRGPEAIMEPQQCQCRRGSCFTSFSISFLFQK